VNKLWKCLLSSYFTSAFYTITSSVRRLFKAETHATNRCDTSRWQIRGQVVSSALLLRQGCLRLFCRYDMSHEFRPVWIRATDCSDNNFHMSHEATCCSNCRGDVTHSVSRPSQSRLSCGKLFITCSERAFPWHIQLFWERLSNKSVRDNAERYYGLWGSWSLIEPLGFLAP